MDIEIIIKGGEELSEFYPKNYEAFQKKIGELILDAFPGVGGWCFSSKLTDRHQAEEQKREQIRDENFKQTLIRVFDKPEFQDKLHKMASEIVPAELPTA